MRHGVERGRRERKCSEEMGFRVFVVKRGNKRMAFLNASKEGRRRSFLGSTKLYRQCQEILMRTELECVNCVVCIQFLIYFLSFMS